MASHQGIANAQMQRVIDVAIQRKGDQRPYRTYSMSLDILQNSSPRLAKLNPRPGKTVIIHMDVNVDVFPPFCQYLYTGTLNHVTHFHTLNNLYILAIQLEHYRLANDIINKIQSKLNEQPFANPVHEAIEETPAVYQDAHPIRHWALRRIYVHYLLGALLRHDPSTGDIRILGPQVDELLVLCGGDRDSALWKVFMSELRVVQTDKNCRPWEMLHSKLCEKYHMHREGERCS